MDATHLPNVSHATEDLYVSYDLHAFRENGLRHEQAWDTVMDDSGDPIPDAFRFDHDSLASTLVRRFSELDRQDLPDGAIVLNAPESRPVEISLEPHLASVSFPYWEFAPEVWRNVTEFLVAFAEEAEALGLAVYDPQTGNLFDAEDLGALFARVETTRAQVFAQVTPLATAPKPWWRFW